MPEKEAHREGDPLDTATKKESEISIWGKEGVCILIPGKKKKEQKN